jgi:RND family efflux transporter MFP subunit
MKTSHLAAPLAAVLALAGCGRHSESSSAAASSLPPAKVRVAIVQTERLPDITVVAGVIRPVQRAQIAAKVMGAIEEMPVTLGQHVKTGDVLVKISAGEISARVAQAQSQLNAARRDLERERSLLKQGASTADMVRGLEDRFAAAEAQVREAETMLSYATVRAPFDGVIARKSASAGDLASPGFPLLELEGTDGFQVEAAVPDSLAAGLKPDTKLVVEVPALDTSFEARLAELSSAADPNAHTVLAKLAVPADARVRSGQYARIQVPGSPVASLTVPAGAVSAMGQMERVFVTGADGRTALRLVKTGATRNDRVEILAGLDAGERVVVEPPAGLREGQPVEALR